MPKSTPLLNTADFTSYLNEKSMQLAPGDLKTLVAQAAAIRHRAREVAADRPRLQRQIDFALTLVDEHYKGRCPQIPYYTIAALAVALLYFSDPVDVIPDWIPGVGITDDAIVFELAFAMARPGVDRYCAWKSLPMGDLYPPPPAKAPARVAAKAPARRAAKRAPAAKRRTPTRKTRR
jgi:uncharacterized membrane protein YkvA (DUF1232 family)